MSEMTTRVEFVLKMFDECFTELFEEGGKRKLNGLFSDNMGNLLISVCKVIPHAPLMRTIAPVDTAFTSKIGGASAIVYSFYHNVNSIGQNALIFLVKTGEAEIRMFALETHMGGFYLCEYYDNRHRNYGKAGLVALEQRIAEIIAKRDEDSSGGNMSKTGDWGDKIIITLHSDGVRRHKKWCINYQDDNYFSLLCEKCRGSAHCKYYKTEIYSATLGDAEAVEEKKEICEEEMPHHPEFEEHYSLASYGDKLLHKTVLVKISPHSAKFGEVVDEDFYYFTAKIDGKPHKYVKRISYARKGIYILTERKEIEE